MRGRNLYESKERAAGLTEAPAAAPIIGLHSSSQLPLGGTDLNGAWLGCEPAYGAGRESSPGQRRNRRCVSLGLVVIKCIHHSPPPHRHLFLPFRTSSPFLCLYLLWRQLKTCPWLPGGPEAEVTSLCLERL